MTKKSTLIKQGYFFGLGFTMAAYLVMWFLDGVGGLVRMIFNIVIATGGGGGGGM